MKTRKDLWEQFLKTLFISNQWHCCTESYGKKCFLKNCRIIKRKADYATAQTAEFFRI